MAHKVLFYTRMENNQWDGGETREVQEKLHFQDYCNQGPDFSAASAFHGPQMQTILFRDG